MHTRERGTKDKTRRPYRRVEDPTIYSKQNEKKSCILGYTPEDTQAPKQTISSGYPFKGLKTLMKQLAAINQTKTQQLTVDNKTNVLKIARC